MTHARQDHPLDGEAILASLRAVDPVAIMPLEDFRLKRRRLDRLHPEPLLELLAGLLAWCHDGAVQLAGLPAAPTDWARVCRAADRVLFGLLSSFRAGQTPPAGSPASLRLLHLGQALLAVTAEVRRRRDASILEQVLAVRDASQPPVRLLQPFLFALYRKGLWRTAEQRADLASRVLDRLIRYLEVGPPRRPAPWIASSPVRQMLQAPARPEWDAALEQFLLDDLRRARAEHLPAIRLEPTWAIWHVTNAEQTRIRRTRQREQRLTAAVPDLEETVEELLDPEQELLSSVDWQARQARWATYLAGIARRGRKGPRKAEALNWLFPDYGPAGARPRQDGTSQAVAARRARLDPKTLRSFLEGERSTLARLARGLDPL